MDKLFYSLNIMSKRTLFISVFVVTFLSIILITACVLVFGHKSDVRYANNGNDTNGTCEIFSTSQNSPLLIYPGTTTLVYPAPGSNSTRFSLNETVEFCCPGNAQVTVDNNQFDSLVTATCINGSTFSFNGIVIDTRNVSCSRAVLPTVIQQTVEDLQDDDPIQDCFKIDRTLVGSIGFTLSPNRSLSFIKVCFSTTSKIALYSYYNLTSSINNRAKNVTSPQFRQDDIFYRMGTSVNGLYQSNQTTINNLLDLTPDSDKYINSYNYINRGHLAAKADFYYAILQTATYRYINAAPQFSTINGGNWNQIEIGVRNYAFNNKIDLQIWTGTYGIAVLPNINSEPKNLYLYVNQNDTVNSPAFPIPAIFWKIVYDPLNQKGVVLVGHNNPYEEVSQSAQKICDIDVSNNVTWINWDRSNITKGYSYACDYNDAKFQKTVTYIPKIVIKQLLI